MNPVSEMHLEFPFKRHVIASDSLYYHNSSKLIGFRFTEKYANVPRNMAHISHCGNKSRLLKIHLIAFDYGTKSNYLKIHVLRFLEGHTVGMKYLAFLIFVCPHLSGILTYILTDQNIRYKIMNNFYES